MERVGHCIMFYNPMTHGDLYPLYNVVVMDMVIFRTIFFELLVFFTFTLLIFHFAY